MLLKESFVNELNKSGVSVIFDSNVENDEIDEYGANEGYKKIKFTLKSGNGIK